MFETDADRLAMLQAAGEEFDTGRPTRLVGVFDRTFNDADLSNFRVTTGQPVLQCRDVDVAAHELVKQSKLTRVWDGKVYFVKDLQPDGTGMTVLTLRS